ncbi:flagellar hook-basal body complex protein [Terrilactibacillus laevilacticus]|uniref:Flagellar hook protein FlgE n=1 Tax=Terrilactibacillus laevilacticus TaxID=1380157 RepID=A0ABW5PPV2_9BACI|nr:flagellar hook-basal body complex protein [Terrilactibacillus laevilacticus]
MLRSLYAGVSGLKNYQTQLDVIGNNIANVGTTGFKKGRANFSDLFNQTLTSSTPSQNAANTNGVGGTNASQIGLGSQIGSIDTIASQGNAQTTGRTLDLMIQGEGYFQVTDGTNTYYTRAGNFYLDENRDLVTSEGLKVLSSGQNGTPINFNPNNYSSITISSDGTISGIRKSDQQLETIVRIGVATFANPEGLEKVGGSLFARSANSGAAEYTGQGEVKSGALEMSNVDLTDEFTGLITSQRGYQANARVITTADQILQELTNLKRN